MVYDRLGRRKIKKSYNICMDETPFRIAIGFIIFGILFIFGCAGVIVWAGIHVLQKVW